MFSQQFAPRYLTTNDPKALRSEQREVLVVGSGIAGSRAALEAARHSNVTLVTKGPFRESNTNYALGGIAAAIAPHDSPESHAKDTIEAGKQLTDNDLVQSVVEDGCDLVEQLIEWGTNFDQMNGEIDFTQEGGHSRRRILHARGDQTGKEIVTTLKENVVSNERISIMEHTFVIDLLTNEEGCSGLIVENEDGERMILYSPAVILCSGGAGQVYRETTNPPVATGDGVALAYRAGASLRDLEFYQFHPTTLYIAGSGRSLISESVRGEGGKLVDRNGYRFMEDVHPDAELAPRDIVSRGINEHIAKTGATCVYLDLTDLDSDFVQERFPRLTELCEKFEIDVSIDPIPVHPSAHYQIGGIRTDERGRTDIPGLYAAGEVASTGFHGANRLGSNSLLEGLVFGYRAGATSEERPTDTYEPNVPWIRDQIQDGNKRDPEFIDLEDMKQSVKSLNWRQCGIVRSTEGLEDALYKLSFWCSYLLDREMDTREGWEVQNMFTFSRLLVFQAWKREESRGVHYRSDFPEPDDETFCRSLTIDRDRFPEQMNEAFEFS